MEVTSYAVVTEVALKVVGPAIENCRKQGWTVTHVLFMGHAQVMDAVSRVVGPGRVAAPITPMYALVCEQKHDSSLKPMPPSFIGKPDAKNN
jgi:uncharacterized protein GlcG (DUF336 family)